MAIGLRVEDNLDGEVNFGAWKERMILLLQESELSDIVENSTTNPITIPTDATLVAAYNKQSIKAKRIIFDAIKDHLIPHVTRKTNAYEMWESLTKLYQSTNENWKMVLREKLKSIRKTKTEKVVTYLTRLTQVRDELGVVGEAIVDNELVRTILNGVCCRLNTHLQMWKSLNPLSVSLEAQCLSPNPLVTSIWTPSV
jgi:hypothetical protein